MRPPRDIPWIAIATAGLAAAAQALVTSSIPDAVATIITQAQAVRDLVEHDDAKAFLDAAQDLPDPGERTVLISPDRKDYYTKAQADALDPAARDKLTTRQLDASFYYNTAFGTPAIYARPLDLAAKAAGGLKNKKVLDFGYGMIGQGRMLAAIGCDVHATDVWPMLPALYSQPSDTGEIIGRSGAKGRLTLHHGRWPADPAITAAVGNNIDIVVTKNVLKRGYIHPERPVDESRLVKLGVDDDTFVRSMHDALKPGGVVIIYNISPAQNPPEKDGKPLPYLPHADGRCPFPRDMLERHGFEVLAFEKDDTPTIHTMWPRLGLIDQSKTSQLKDTLFAQYTMVRRKK